MIVFLKEKEDHFGLYAIQGFEDSRNLYVNDNGNWLSNYVPAYYRMQPFNFILDSKTNDLLLCFDENTNLVGKNLKKDQSHPMFDKKEQPTDKFLETIKFSKKFHESTKKTMEVTALLSNLNLIEPWPIKLKFENEEKKIEGIYRINHKKLHDLKSSDILSLFEKRGLELAYCQIVSMNNIVYIQQLHSQNNNNSGSVSKVKSLRDQAVEKQKKEEIDAVNDLVSDLLSDD